MNRTARGVVAGVLGLLFAANAWAMPLVAPPVRAEGHAWEAGARLGMMDETRYSDFDRSFEIQRDVLTLYGSYEWFFFGAGFVDNSEITWGYDYYPMIYREDGAGDAWYYDYSQWQHRDGYIGAIGVRVPAWTQGKTALNVYAQAGYMEENYRITAYDYPVPLMDTAGMSAPDDIYPVPEYTTIHEKVRFKATEVLIGAVVSHSVKHFSAYAGIEATPYANISLEGLEDVSRTRSAAFRAGGTLDINDLYINAEIQMAGSSGIIIGIGRGF